MRNKLILVEGLPGSGKSTIARKIFNILSSKGLNVKLYTEEDYNHPADFDGFSYFSKKEFTNLLNKYSNYKNLLNKFKKDFYHGYLIHYRKAIDENNLIIDNTLLNDFKKNDVYDLSITLHEKLILKRWKDFVLKSKETDEITIFECCFIQNPVTITMIKDNASKSVTINYIKKLEKIIKPLNPILIYANQDDIEISLTKIIEERPNEWFEGFKIYYTEQGYGSYFELRDVEGVLKILESRKLLEDEIYMELSLIKYKINNSLFDITLLNNDLSYILKEYF